MELWLLLIIIGILGFTTAFMDSALGMGYGLLTPMLMLLNLEPVLIVPILLLTQMIIGFSSTFFHQRLKNVSLEKKSFDTKVTIVFTASGVIGMVLALIFAVNLSEIFMTFYIGLMLVFIGILTLFKVKFKFSWSKLYAISVVSGFNKAISGGGYGPLVTLGQIMTGRDLRSSIGVTEFSEAFLSGLSFIFYCCFTGFGSYKLTIPLMIVLIITGIVATPIGAQFTKKMKRKHTKIVIGTLSIVLGIITLIRYFPAIMEAYSIWLNS
ncbi:MAG: TSUP family transporter [Candidatus Lokiarchaeota archaeon]|nr:TSUP family transporter [Candidatus Lokiarchaeota archaeon]